MPAACSWCGDPAGGAAACDACGKVACGSCLERAVAEMERRGAPDDAGCPFCAGAFPDLMGLVDWACGELEVSPDELADLWRESRLE